MPVKLTAEVRVPLQSAWSLTPFTTGVGFTVITKVVDRPIQVFEAALTVIKAVAAMLVPFVAVNEPIFPVEPAPSPIVGLLLIQVKMLPAVGLVNVAPAANVLLHNDWFEIVLTTGIGFTVIEKV